MDSFEKLKKWLHIKDNIKMYNRPERGLYTTKEIKKGEIIIKIKSKYLLEYSSIYALYPISNINERNSLIAFYLMKLHLENNQFWSHYIDALPKNLDENIIYFNKKKLTLLNNTSLTCKGFYNYHDHYKSINQDCITIFNFMVKYNILSDHFNNVLYNLDDLDYETIDDWSYDKFHELFIYFRIIVGSRVFGYTKNNFEESGMIPYIDMINYSPESNTTWYFDEYNDSFILQSITNIPKNCEICDDYGSKTNTDFFMYYGFTLSDNPYTTLKINVDNNILEITKNYNGDLSIFRDKLKNIYNHHIHLLPTIKDINIQNIYKDELNIIKSLNIF